MSNKYESLYELTGQESGAVYYPESGEILILNWMDVQGLPRLFAGAAIGLGESLQGRRIAVPEQVKRAMREHEREQGCRPSRSGYRAWLVNDVAIVVCNHAWH